MAVKDSNHRGSAAGSLAADLLAAASKGAAFELFATGALLKFSQACGAEYVALVRLSASSLKTLAEWGTPHKLPRELVIDALDREGPAAAAGWVALPMAAREGAREALAIFGAASDVDLAPLAGLLRAALELAREREQEHRRISRLETILAITQEWNRTSEMEPLLKQMAEAATRLLDADRASIFLWDRQNKSLVARPALGVAGGELRIADNVGVAGEVVHSGELRRIDAEFEQQAIHRDVDTKLGYHTQTLLAVPLVVEGDVLGAFEVLNKRGGNFTRDDEAALVELAGHAAIALANTQHLEELLTTHRQIVDQAASNVQLIGHSAPIEALRSTVQRVADTELAVLILGENGTGKEVVSQSIHYLSRRRNQPCIAVNCAAIAETLLESELFGHEKGAFTDAHEARPGKFELASGGTLFLDEIGDLSRGGQAKLLRVLEEKVVVRVGGSKSIHTDARVIAATNRDLGEMVRAKTFREDLYYRLNVVSLELPPLRDRGDDVVLLAEHFLRQFSKQARRGTPKLMAAARKRLCAHTWPGNIRELRNLMERIAYLHAGDKIEAEDLAFIMAPGEGPALIDAGLELTEATHRFQIEYIKSAIDRMRGNMSEAATQLGLHRSNLYRKMRQLGMPVREEDA